MPEKNFIERASSFVQAQVSAKRVSLEVVQERYETCKACDLYRNDPQKNEEYCGAGCRCPVKPRSSLIKALTEVEENLPKWGCKHPQRKRGKGWKR